MVTEDASLQAHGRVSQRKHKLKYCPVPRDFPMPTLTRAFTLLVPHCADFRLVCTDMDVSPFCSPQLMAVASFMKQGTLNLSQGWHCLTGLSAGLNQPNSMKREFTIVIGFGPIYLSLGCIFCASLWNLIPQCSTGESPWCTWFELVCSGCGHFTKAPVQLSLHCRDISSFFAVREGEQTSCPLPKQFLILSPFEYRSHNLSSIQSSKLTPDVLKRPFPSRLCFAFVHIPKCS